MIMKHYEEEDQGGGGWVLKRWNIDSRAPFLTQCGTHLSGDNNWTAGQSVSTPLSAGERN